MTENELDRGSVQVSPAGGGQNVGGWVVQRISPTDGSTITELYQGVVLVDTNGDVIPLRWVSNELQKHTELLHQIANLLRQMVPEPGNGD